MKYNNLQSEIKNFLLRDEIKNSFIMFFVISCRVVFQFITFILLARYFGPTNLGIFASALSLIVILTPFAEMGGPAVVVKDIVANVPVMDTVSRNIQLSYLAAVPLLVIILISKIFFLENVSVYIILLLAAAEFIGNRMIMLIGAVHQAKGFFWRNAIMELVFGSSRLLIIGIVLLFKGSLLFWTVLYMLQSILTAAVFFCWMKMTWKGKLGLWDRSAIKERLHFGFHFAFGSFAQNTFNEVDKLLLARLSSLRDVGIYSVGVKFSQAAFLPIGAILGVTYPIFFRKGIEGGYNNAKRFALKLIPIPILYGIAIAGFFWVISPYLPVILGDKYNDSLTAIKLLGFIPLFQGTYWLLADAMTGGGRQSTRTRIQILAVLISVLLNIILIPIYGWSGAVYTALTVNALLMIIYLIA